MNAMKSWVAAAAVLAMAGTAQAALVLQANGLEVLDTNTNLVWLKDWDVNGYQVWATQKAWAETGLDGFAGSNDWRLPSIGEFVALFTAYGDLRSNTLPFVDVQTNYYWSGTEITPGTDAWQFSPNGYKNDWYQNNKNYAVAVRTGNVTATVPPVSVPEPQTLALTLLALGATLAARRRRAA